MRAEQITQAQVKATLTTKHNDNHINSHNRVMLQHYKRANIDLQTFIDPDQCVHNMAKYAVKCEPRSNSATGILKLCVKRLHQTDPALPLMLYVELWCRLLEIVILVPRKLNTCSLENHCISFHFHSSVYHSMEADKSVEITVIKHSMLLCSIIISPEHSG